MKKLLLGALAAILTFSGCGQKGEANSSKAVFTVNDEEISVEEFNIYFYETQSSFEKLGGEDIWETDFDGRTAESVAKDNTFNTVIMVKVAAQRAEKLGLSLDQESLDKIKTEAQAMYDSYSDSAKSQIGADEQLYYDVMCENALYNEVYEDTVKNYVVNEDGFEQYFSSNRENLLQYYKSYVDSTEPVDEEAFKDYSYEYYNESMKQQYFSKEYEKWKAETVIQKNQKIWDTVTLID